MVKYSCNDSVDNNHKTRQKENRSEKVQQTETVKGKGRKLPALCVFSISNRYEKINTFINHYKLCRLCSCIYCLFKIQDSLFNHFCYNCNNSTYNGITKQKGKSKMTIKEARQTVGLTQQGLYDWLGIPVRTIQDWESGRRKCPEWCEKLVVEKILTYNKNNQ